MRVYVPSNLELLGEYVDAGRIPASAERFVAPGDDEESEYAALEAAALAAVELGGSRRVVVVAESEDPDADLPRRRWAAVHADTEDDADPEADLAWFGVQEIEVELLGG